MQRWEKCLAVDRILSMHDEPRQITESIYWQSITSNSCCTLSVDKKSSIVRWCCWEWYCVKYKTELVFVVAAYGLLIAAWLSSAPQSASSPTSKTPPSITNTISLSLTLLLSQCSIFSPSLLSSPSSSFVSSLLPQSLIHICWCLHPSPWSQAS